MRTERHWEWKRSFSPQPVGLLAALGALALALTPACVSGTLVDGAPQQHGNGASQGGSGNSNSSAGGDGQIASSGSPQQAKGGSGTTTTTPTPTTTPPPTGVPIEKACSGADSPGPRVLRRLSASEFAKSIKDLFGNAAVPVAPVFNDLRVLGFTVDSATLQVQDLNADQLMTNAEAVASWATSSEQLSKLTQLSTCSALDETCAKNFIKNFGRKAFRTAVDDAHFAAYTKLFMGEADFASGASAVISAMLQSPYFLYRSEIGAGDVKDGTVTLTPYEVASSLSYLLTGSTPDDTLLKAADGAKNGGASALTTMVKDQAARLLAPSGGDALSAPAQDALMNFMSGWLGLDRVLTSVKDASAAVTDAQRAEMAADTKRFILGIWASSTNNTVSDLFLAQTINPSHPDDKGILSQPSILFGYARSNGSSPTQRGHFVRSRLLCQAVLPPPDGVDTKFTPHADLKTTREQYLKGHASPDNKLCYSCHKVMDPIGVAFEHYDALGKYRDTENGVTIDATGTIYSAGTTGMDVPIDGVAGLQKYLADSQDVKECMVRYWAYYAFGTASWDQDACTYDAIRTEAAGQSYSLKSILTAIINTPRFTKRVNDQ